LKHKKIIPYILIILIIAILGAIPSTRIFLLAPVAITFGIWMLFSFPGFSLYFKLGSLFGLCLSLMLIYLGIKRRKKWTGKLLIVLGTVGWILVGFLGFGTGT